MMIMSWNFYSEWSRVGQTVLWNICEYVQIHEWFYLDSSTASCWNCHC